MLGPVLRVSATEILSRTSHITIMRESWPSAELLGLPSKEGPKTFHVEVKASKAIENGFVFSSRQLNTVDARSDPANRRCAKAIPDGVYVILKVDNAAVV